MRSLSSLVFVVVALACVWQTTVGVPPRDPNGDGFIDTIYDQRQHHETDGDFGFRYKTENGIEFRKAGENGEDGGTVMSGEYSYITPDGSKVHVKWTADERGYRPIVTVYPSDNDEDIGIGGAHITVKDSHGGDEIGQIESTKSSASVAKEEKVVRKRSHPVVSPSYSYSVSSRGRPLYSVWYR